MKKYIIAFLAALLLMSGTAAFAAKGGIKGKPIPPSPPPPDDGGETITSPPAQPFL